MDGTRIYSRDSRRTPKNSERADNQLYFHTFVGVWDRGTPASTVSFSGLEGLTAFHAADPFTRAVEEEAMIPIQYWQSYELDGIACTDFFIDIFSIRYLLGCCEMNDEMETYIVQNIMTRLKLL